MSLRYFLVAEMWLWKSTFTKWREKIKYLWARLKVRNCQSFAKLTTWPVLISWTLSPRIKSVQRYGKNAEQIILCTPLAIFTLRFQGKYHYSQWLWKQWEKQTKAWEGPGCLHSTPSILLPMWEPRHCFLSIGFLSQEQSKISKIWIHCLVTSCRW